MKKTILSMVRSSGRQRALVLGLAAAVLGIAALATFFFVQKSPPPAESFGTVKATASPKAPATPAPSSSAKSTTPVEKPVQPSKPTSISIPAIGVQSAVIPIGKTSDGGLDVPKGKTINDVAWFDKSPTPGQIGPSVVEGHIDTVNGPSVFYKLADLKTGNSITVKRKDGSTATFKVTGARSFSTKGAFPTKLVYGGDLSKATLRLITCSNFNKSTGHYAGNTVVFAELSKFSPAG